MITPWTIYWITRLDSIQTALEVARMSGALACLAIAGFGAAACAENSWSWVAYRRTLTQLICGTLLLWIPAILIPSTKEMAAILVLPKVANSRVAQDLAGVGLDLVTLAKQWIATLKPNSESTK